MKSLDHQTVLVLGLGDSGLAMARWCARQGAAVRAADSRETPPQAAALEQAVPGATMHHGFDPSLLDGVQRVLKSPGLSPLDPALAPLLARAAELGVPVEGELDLFAQALAELKTERGYAPKVIAITGTNGKTTTTVMCGQLIERSGLRVAVAGNVGPTMLGTLAAALEKEGEPECPSPQPSPAPAGEGDEPRAPAGAGEGDEAPAPSPTPVGEGGGEGPPLSEPADDDDEAPLQLAPPPPAAPVFEHLPEAWVLELSSFQLDGVRGFVPDAAVVLNVTQDHLDWHGSMPAYAAAKSRIYGPSDAWGSTMVINRDDTQVEAMIPAPLPQKGRFAKPLARKVVRFGLDAPQRPGDYGLVVENGMAWLVRALEADETIKRRKGDAEEEIHLQRLMPADALRIRGRHNAANALAALALATAIGRPLAPMLHGLREYGGEPHRVEFIATVGGVEAYDDSKGTNVGATVAALDGLGADKAPAKLVVILGGDGKGQDFTPLVAPVARHARAVALIGRDAPAIEAVLGAGSVPLARHDTLQAATRWCFEQARAGDAVLLSPACASLDMFRNYAQRAQVFCDTVRELACEHGETA
ncbi:UDP-N-acetylmuramoyl-L-alanine--D-glutamate ligase [Methylibium sp. Root1272]|uniref:UDP-N-acetylmuramoyl-L-alanine--D-glutamate ligase n=1 Tax=Methylibium sp. Root1272 TaxID=1736441 RepID=UPI0006FD892C|nr:UDP-N-acetylmuramoyl-L-alanine--D-glutamate ligase [Methylibium sp. Root1272]KQW65625.1 UDP-N-acetylmuramoylalanine--D-glutamate ligase [Methylibium sp. Root1272]